MVGPDDKIALRHVTLGRNLDAEVEVLQGLSPSDRVVDSPPDALASGDVVGIAGKPSPDQEEETAAR